jgi:hypothetical protein
MTKAREREVAETVVVLGVYFWLMTMTAVVVKVMGVVL